MFENWETSYNYENSKVEDKKNTNNYNKTQICDWFKNKYHNYHHGTYQGESIKSIGVHGDKPFDKFSDQSQGCDRLYSDNYNIAIGTTKNTNHTPGYSGNNIKI